MVDVDETYPIMDDIDLPLAKAVAAHSKKAGLDPIRKEKRISLETNMDNTRFDNISDNLWGLFSTPSVVRGEDPAVHAELHALVVEVAQPKDVWDQMMVADITNHFWEQQRYRRCTGTIINSKRRAALETILHGAIGLNDVNTETAADTYFGVERLEEREVTDYSTQVRIPKTRADVVALLEKHGFAEAEIERVAMETSVDTLADIESLAFKHESLRQAIFRVVERRRKKKRYEESHRANPRLTSKVRALANDLPEKPTEPAS
jgi:hypothetical protein